MVSDEDSLLELLAALRSHGYRFTCVTPATHERVLARPLQRAPDLRDIFGWNRPFAAEQIEPNLLQLLERAGCLDDAGGGLRSRVRVASLGEHLFLHSSFPTSSADAVFFGPDTYRFVRYVLDQRELLEGARRIADMGAGSGAGGIVAAAHAPSAEVKLVEINPDAARLARVNARFAGVAAEVLVSDRMPDGCDLVIANPPYMMDAEHRTYRDGGDRFGGEIACRWVEDALRGMAPEGTLLLYTGAAVVDGRTPLVEEIEALCRNAGAAVQIEEIDPDVFGEELEKPAYREVERVAALGFRISLSRPIAA